MTSSELAQKIIDLLENDPGVAEVYSKVRHTHEMPPAETTCTGCGQVFLPAGHGRQFCSRDCYNAYLKRKRKGGK